MSNQASMSNQVSKASSPSSSSSSSQQNSPKQQHFYEDAWFSLGDEFLSKEEFEEASNASCGSLMEQQVRLLHSAIIDQDERLNQEVDELFDFDIEFDTDYFINNL